MSAVYGGDTANVGSSAATPFKIKKVGTTITLSGNATGAAGADSAIVATLKDAGSPSKPIGGRTVWFVVSTGANVSDPNAFSRSALTNNLGEARLGVVGLPAGTYTVQAFFGGPVTLRPGGSTFSATDGTYDVSPAATKTYVVTKKTVTLGYTGNLFWSAGSATTASVTFTGQVTPFIGGTTPANNTVDFSYYNAATPATVSHCSNGSINDAGVASCTVPSLGLGDWVVVMSIPASNGYYVAPVDADAAVLTVYQTNAAKYASGAGHIVDPSSGSMLVKVLPSKNRGNFGFAVSYKTGTTPQGVAVYSFRATDNNDYIFTTSSWTGGGLSFGTGTTASFSNKCSVVVFNPTTHKIVTSLGGTNFTCRFDVTDGSPDKLAFSAWNAAGALYHQAGTSTAQVNLSGGSIIVKK